jgi:pyruvate/2-oxoglutarate dehydrogenase complex dihydrolipoamide dehydrogenase (E3) component
MDVVVIGGGPAGSSAALRAAELGARTVLVTRGEFGGMSTNDGPIQIRTLAQAARLLRKTRQLSQHGIAVSEPILDYPQLLVRTREIVDEVCEHSTSREHLERVGVTIYEQAGTARFIDQHTVETGSGLRFRADKVILSAGGTNRRLSVPGFEWTATHSDAWG